MAAGMAEIWNQDLRKHVVTVMCVRRIYPKQRRSVHQNEAEVEEEA